MMHTELYCPSLDQLDPVEAIRAIHAAWLQLQAAERGVEALDHHSALVALQRCLKAAGHPAGDL